MKTNPEKKQTPSPPGIDVRPLQATAPELENDDHPRENVDLGQFGAPTLAPAPPGPLLDAVAPGEDKPPVEYAEVDLHVDAPVAHEPARFFHVVPIEPDVVGPLEQPGNAGKKLVELLVPLSGRPGADGMVVAVGVERGVGGLQLAKLRVEVLVQLGRQPIGKADEARLLLF